jgi:hypothetical protein
LILDGHVSGLLPENKKTTQLTQGLRQKEKEYQWGLLE